MEGCYIAYMMVKTTLPLVLPGIDGWNPEYIKDSGKKIEDIIDMSFYTTLVDKAVDTINKHTDIEWFLSDDVIPWKTECGKDTCVGCNHLLKHLTINYVVSDMTSVTTYTLITKNKNYIFKGEIIMTVLNQRGVLQIDDCRIIFRNFAGEEDQYNRQGDRNFALVIPDEELATQLKDDGWNVKIKPARVEGELPLMFLPVKVTFSERSGPACYIDSNGNRVQLDADTVHRLDKDRRV